MLVEGVGAGVMLLLLAALAIWVFTAHAATTKEFYGTSDGSGALACETATFPVACDCHHVIRADVVFNAGCRFPVCSGVCGGPSGVR